MSYTWFYLDETLLVFLSWDNDQNSYKENNTQDFVVIKKKIESSTHHKCLGLMQEYPFWPWVFLTLKWPWRLTSCHGCTFELLPCCVELLVLSVFFMLLYQGAWRVILREMRICFSCFRDNALISVCYHIPYPRESNWTIEIDLLPHMCLAVY